MKHYLRQLLLKCECFRYFLPSTNGVSYITKSLVIVISNKIRKILAKLEKKILF